MFKPKNERQYDLVSCNKCKHKLDRLDAKVVEKYPKFYPDNCSKNNIYFCDACKPGYTKVIFTLSPPHMKYYKEFEVTEKGKLVKK